MAIKFYNEDSSYRLRQKRRAAEWAMRTIEEEGCVAGDINYIFCSPQYHIEINRRYLGHDYNTDVITFDYGFTDPENPKNGASARIVSGDIFIDPSTVRLNASAYGATAAHEMLRVVIHGVLHLCGYKDKSHKDARLMRSKEDYYLEKY